MKNKKFDDLYKQYQALASEDEEYALLSAFMLSSSFEELMAWNQYLAAQTAQFQKQKPVLSEDDKKAFSAQFAKIDALIAQLSKPAY